MNTHTCKLLDNLQNLRDPRGFQFETAGNWVAAHAPNPLPDGHRFRLDLICADDGTMIIVQTTRFLAKAFTTMDDWKAIFRAQERFRLLRFTLPMGNALLTPRLDFFLPNRQLPTESDAAYLTILDLSVTILGPTVAFLTKRIRDGIWDETLIMDDPPELKSLNQEIRTLEDQLQTRRKREDFLREAVAPGSRVLPNFI